MGRAKDSTVIKMNLPEGADEQPVSRRRKISLAARGRQILESNERKAKENGILEPEDAEKETGETDAADSTPKWILNRRLEFIDYRLAVDGKLNRQDMASYFGISIPQASLDLSSYIDLVQKKYPGKQNFHYDHRFRCYLRSKEFVPLFPEVSEPAVILKDLLSSATGEPPGSRSYLGYIPNVGVASFDPPKRTVSAQTLRNLIDAMHNRMAMHITYMSLNRNANSDHLIAPHAFAYDGVRWHVRAYCYDRHAFRDYVLSRIVQSDVPTTLAPADRFPNPRNNGFDEVGTSSEDDADWNEMVTLRLTANPALPQRTRRVIEHDYGLDHDGVLIYTCRKALLFYALKHMRLAPEYNALPPEERQLVLVNEAEVLSKLEENT